MPTECADPSLSFKVQNSGLPVWVRTVAETSAFVQQRVCILLCPRGHGREPRRGGRGLDWQFCDHAFHLLNFLNALRCVRDDNLTDARLLLSETKHSKQKQNVFKLFIVPSHTIDAQGRHL